jgi:hypothetical protein
MFAEATGGEKVPGAEVQVEEPRAGDEGTEDAGPDQVAGDALLADDFRQRDGQGQRQSLRAGQGEEAQQETHP